MSLWEFVDFFFLFYIYVDALFYRAVICMICIISEYIPRGRNSRIDTVQCSINKLEIILFQLKGHSVI